VPDRGGDESTGCVLGGGGVREMAVADGGGANRRLGSVGS
jgi:hypothetical protein